MSKNNFKFPNNHQICFGSAKDTSLDFHKIDSHFREDFWEIFNILNQNEKYLLLKAEDSYNKVISDVK
jgi:hypothetical protein